MSPPHEARSRRVVSTIVAVTRSAHIGPAVGVTALATALAIAGDVASTTVALLLVAVLSGQLVVGWSNDLVDRDRDRVVGREDKPLATGEIRPRAVVAATSVAGVSCVVASAACGWAAGTAHLVLGVGAALAYNLGVKATAFSWVPYLVAFGSMPIVVGLAGRSAQFPPLWTAVVAGLLGVGAHLLNAMPDLDDDEMTGVRGLPHRLGRERLPVAAGALLLGATVVCVVATSHTWWRWVALAAAIAVIAGSVRAPGRRPFYASMVVAGIDVAILLVSSTAIRSR